MRTHDKVEETSDRSKWDYSGDKVHVSVEPGQIEDAWNVMLPFLLGHSDTIKEFKVTDMATVKTKLPAVSAQRIYYGTQISIYLHAAPRDEADAAGRFAGVMKGVSRALKTFQRPTAGQRPADQRLRVVPP